MTWLCLRDGLSGHQSTVALAKAFEIDRRIAAEWVQISMDRFRDLGLIETAGSTATARAPRPRGASPKSAMSAPREDRAPNSDCSSKSYLVARPGPLEAVDRLIAPVLTDPADRKEHARADIEIDIIANGNRWDIVVDGQLEATCEARAIAAEVERLLVQRVVPATPHLLTLHAAALQRDDRAWLLTGLSRAGKTTLSLALARAGWRFGSDEIVLLGRNRDLRALPLPPCIKADSFPLIESWFPELRSAPEHERYGHIVKYLPMRSTPISGTLGFVVFLRFDARGPNEIQPLDRFSALERLLAQCVFVPPGFQHNDVEQLLRWHGEQNYFNLCFSDSNAAVAILATLAGTRP